ncbi:peroxiredoxin [Sphingobium yanoikuyae]|jgi:thioredoxin-dependent peroxiredoxin|uniref:peroxiredoxin n=1 Tax=Sphingobium yanoikuyae TaxID=13690 RepID=UPI002430D278|nr:peroxiredoxin [Sphingobium yanoikuyae]
MKSAKIILALAAAALGTQGSMAALAVGAKAPEFTTRGALAGKTFTVTLSHQLKRGPVVLYFFPKAFTPGCSAEAREFAENIDKFKAAGATVIGMSADPVDDLVAFSTKECAGKFAVASAGPNIVSGYDVALKMRPGMTDRTSYVIAPSGRIAFVHSEMSYAGHVKSTLGAVEAMKQK